MNLSNLPPGVSDNMIPGNRAEDEAWERFHEKLDADCTREGLDWEGALQVWKYGMAWRALMIQRMPK
jgi:hypothetical protein